MVVLKYKLTIQRIERTFVIDVLRNIIMINKLGDIVNIQTGLFTKTEKEGNAVYLQAKDFDENGILKGDILHYNMTLDKQVEKHLLKPNDILFAAKGTKNFAAVYEIHNPPSVASTTFFVLKIKESNIIPEFISWFLNNENTLNLIKKQAMGTAISSVSKSALNDLPISIPDIKTQKTILKIAALQKREKQLTFKLAELREKLIQQQINKAIGIK